MPSLAAVKPTPGRRQTSTRPKQKLAPAPPIHCAPGCLGFKGVTVGVVIQANTGSDGLRGVVAIGASAWGVEALSNLAAGLSPDLPYAYLIALRMPVAATSVLARIVDRKGPLPAVTAEHGADLQPGHIYVARPNHHLLVADHCVVLSQGPTENGHRPAINALFRSVALTFGPRAIGVLLSGVLDDGVLGLAAIRSRGEPRSVSHPTMRCSRLCRPTPVMPASWNSERPRPTSARC